MNEETQKERVRQRALIAAAKAVIRHLPAGVVACLDRRFSDTERYAAQCLRYEHVFDDETDIDRPTIRAIFALDEAVKAFGELATQGENGRRSLRVFSDGRVERSASAFLVAGHFAERLASAADMHRQSAVAVWAALARVLCADPVRVPGLLADADGGGEALIIIE